MKKRRRYWDSFLMACAQVAVLSGCSGFKQTRAQPHQPSRGEQVEPREIPRLPPTCAQRAAQLGDWMNALTAESLSSPGILPTRLGVRLVPSQGREVRPAPIVELIPGRLGLEGRLFAGDADPRGGVGDPVAHEHVEGAVGVAGRWFIPGPSLSPASRCPSIATSLGEMW